jgi:hypothetical protein
MKKMLALASILLLSACATANAPRDTARPQATGGMHYCWKDRLSTEGDALVCNWERSVADACRSNAWSRLARSSVAGEPRQSARCENGEWLVVVQAR